MYMLVLVSEAQLPILRNFGVFVKSVVAFFRPAVVLSCGYYFR